MEEQEIFKIVPEYPRYMISNKGNLTDGRKIYNKNKKFIKYKLIKGTVTNRGYKQTTLTKNKKQYTVTFHYLVANTFLKHTSCGMIKVIDHKDKNTTNNTVKNLQIITHRKNCSKDKKGTIGVSYIKKGKKYRSSISINSNNLYLGDFKTIKEASKQYQKALLYKHLYSTNAKDFRNILNQINEK